MSAERAETYNDGSNEDGTRRVIRFAAPNINPEYEEDTIDLKVLLQELLAKWYLLLIAFIVGAAAYGAYTFFFVTPQYQGTSKIYIYSKSTSITSLADLQIGTQLTNDFQIIAKTREVVQDVIDQLGLNTTYEMLSRKIAINNPSSSRVLEIVVTDPDPEQAALISNTLADVLRARIGEVTNTDEPSVVERAVPINKRVSPSYKKNVLLGGLILFVIMAAIIIIRFLLDDTIKTDEDIRKYLGLNTLAMIPVNHSSPEITYKSSKRRKTSGRSGSRKKA